MIPSRRTRLPLEAPLMRAVATARIIGIGVAIAAITASQESRRECCVERFSRRSLPCSRSAGGLDAVSRVPGGLPEAFGASVVVLIHQRPDQVSRLVKLLTRGCRCPSPRPSIVCGW